MCVGYIVDILLINNNRDGNLCWLFKTKIDYIFSFQSFSFFFKRLYLKVSNYRQIIIFRECTYQLHFINFHKAITTIKHPIKSNPPMLVPITILFVRSKFTFNYLQRCYHFFMKYLGRKSFQINNIP